MGYLTNEFHPLYVNLKKKSSIQKFTTRKNIRAQLIMFLVQGIVYGVIVNLFEIEAYASYNATL